MVNGGRSMTATSGLVGGGGEEDWSSEEKINEKKG